jgi:hypothetical protein
VFEEDQTLVSLEDKDRPPDMLRVLDDDVVVDQGDLYAAAASARRSPPRMELCSVRRSRAPDIAAADCMAPPPRTAMRPSSRGEDGRIVAVRILEVTQREAVRTRGGLSAAHGLGAGLASDRQPA